MTTAVQNPESLSLIQAQKIQRLRINRVAIIQELRVEHVIHHLVATKVLTQCDVGLINRGSIPADRTRILLDLLPQKGHTVDWYRHFCDALKSPDIDSADVRRKYGILIDFLDNTLIGSPPPVRHKGATRSGSGKMKLPHYEPLPSIVRGPPTNHQASATTEGSAAILLHSASQGQRLRKGNMMLIKGFYHHWVLSPPDFVSVLVEQTEDLHRLMGSADMADQQQAVEEQTTLQRMRAIEALFTLRSQRQLPEGFELCLSSAVEDFLADPNMNHLYFKYLQWLQTHHSLNVLEEIAISFTSFVKSLPDAWDDKVRTHVVRIGFLLFEFLQQYGMLYKSEVVMYALVRYLATHQHIETWMATRQACINIMTCRNTNLNFHKIDTVYQTVQEVGRKIRLMSFTNDLLDESQTFHEISTMMREGGRVEPAFWWAQRALLAVNIHDHKSVVDLLCNASVACSMMWHVRKAEELAVEAVRHAREHFSTNHPLYVKALLHLCYVSSEFRQDATSVDLARAALKTAEKIHGQVPVYQTALAHQALATALVANQQFTDDDYHTHAVQALRVAVDVLPEGHPRLGPFRYTLAQCLHWRAAQFQEDEERIRNLSQAESVAKQAVQTFVPYWGRLSIKAAQGYSLLGQIYAKLHRWDDAQSMLGQSLAIQRLSQAPNSNYINLTKATMGTFYITINKPAQAIDLLSDVVANTECDGTYLKWVHMAYDSLIFLQQKTGQSDQAYQYQAMLTEWMSQNPKGSRNLSWSNLHASPRPLETLFGESDTLSTWRRQVRLHIERWKREQETVKDSTQPTEQDPALKAQLQQLQDAEIMQIAEDLKQLQQHMGEIQEADIKQEVKERQQQSLKELIPESPGSRGENQLGNGSNSAQEDQVQDERIHSALERELREVSADIRRKQQRDHELEAELKEIAARIIALQEGKDQLQERLNVLEAQQVSKQQRNAGTTASAGGERQNIPIEESTSASDYQEEHNAQLTEETRVATTSRAAEVQEDEKSMRKSSDKPSEATSGDENTLSKVPPVQSAVGGQETKAATDLSDEEDTEVSSNEQIGQQLKVIAETFEAPPSETKMEAQPAENGDQKTGHDEWEQDL